MTPKNVLRDILAYPARGSSTGLPDANGRLICVGDLLKMPVTGNVEYHGEWCVHEVEARGTVAVLLYVTSEKGDMFPRGYTGSLLSDKYDRKMLLWGTDLASVLPGEEMVVLDVQEFNDLCNSRVDPVTVTGRKRSQELASEDKHAN